MLVYGNHKMLSHRLMFTVDFACRVFLSATPSRPARVSVAPSLPTISERVWIETTLSLSKRIQKRHTITKCLRSYIWWTNRFACKNEKTPFTRAVNVLRWTVAILIQTRNKLNHIFLFFYLFRYLHLKWMPCESVNVFDRRGPHCPTISYV